jgi:hypothetical protein
LGYSFVPLPIVNHQPPAAGWIDDFIKKVMPILLSPHQWVHFHCKGGKARTTIALTVSQLLCHALMPLEALLRRQTANRGKNFLNEKYQGAHPALLYLQDIAARRQQLRNSVNSRLPLPSAPLPARRGAPY